MHTWTATSSQGSRSTPSSNTSTAASVRASSAAPDFPPSSSSGAAAQRGGCSERPLWLQAGRAGAAGRGVARQARGSRRAHRTRSAGAASSASSRTRHSPGRPSVLARGSLAGAAAAACEARRKGSAARDRSEDVERASRRSRAPLVAASRPHRAAPGAGSPRERVARQTQDGRRDLLRLCSGHSPVHPLLPKDRACAVRREHLRNLAREGAARPWQSAAA